MTYTLCFNFNGSWVVLPLADWSSSATSRNWSSHVPPAILLGTTCLSFFCSTFPSKSLQQKIRPTYHHSTGPHEHSSVPHVAKYKVPTISNSWNHYAHQCHQVVHARDSGIDGKMMIDDMETASGRCVSGISLNLTFSCLFLCHMSDVTVFHARP